MNNYKDENNNYKDENTIIKSRTELEVYLNDFYNIDEILTKYNDRYFEVNSLALLYRFTNNGCQKVRINKIKISSDTLRVKVNIYSKGEICEMWKSEYLIVVEVPKKVIKISSE